MYRWGRVLRTNANRSDQNETSTGRAKNAGKRTSANGGEQLDREFFSAIDAARQGREGRPGVAVPFRPLFPRRFRRLGFPGGQPGQLRPIPKSLPARRQFTESTGNTAWNCTAASPTGGALADGGERIRTKCCSPPSAIVRCRSFRTTAELPLLLLRTKGRPREVISIPPGP